MSIIGVIITLAIVGVALYIVETLLPMDPAIKKAIRVIALLFVCLWLLQVLGFAAWPVSIR